LPAPIEQPHISHAPESQNPPDSGRFLVPVIVVDHDLRIGVDAQLGDPLAPAFDILSVLKGFRPGRRIHPAGIGNVPWSYFVRSRVSRTTYSHGAFAKSVGSISKSVRG